MATVDVEVQLLPSVIVTVYVLAARLLMVCEVAPPGPHTKVYPGVPPVVDAVAIPVEVPKQLIFVELEIPATTPAVFAIVAFAAFVQPLVSVTVTE